MLGNEIMTKEQLYDLFQQVLGVKKFEHQLLYNAMQVRDIANILASVWRNLRAETVRLVIDTGNRYLWFSSAEVSKSLSGFKNYSRKLGVLQSSGGCVTLRQIKH